MKKTTKLMSLLLTLAMIITMLVPATVSAASFSDVASDHHYYEAIHNLSAEGILNGFEDGTFKPGEPVTRAQFTKIICYALSVGELSYSEGERSIFTDVAPEHWAANNIVTAYKQGIINGMGDGTFAPEAGVNYEQAVKMVVCALGYTPENAERVGGYPAGYMTLANRAKILTGIKDAKMGEVMNRGAVAKLVDNFRDADQVRDGEIGGSLREEASQDKKIEGQIVSAYGMSLYTGPNPCSKIQMELDLGGDREDNLFDISEINFDAEKYIGREVAVYYEAVEGSRDRIVKNIVLLSNKNNETQIDFDDIIEYDSDSIEYYTDSTHTRTAKANYDADAKILFNGIATEYTIEEILDDNILKTGYINLLSSSSSRAGVAIIRTYNMMVLLRTDKQQYKIYAKNNSPTHPNDGMVVDVYDTNKRISIKRNGSDYAFESLRENHILLISESADHKNIEVLVSDKTASGTIAYKYSDPDRIILSSGNTAYIISGDIYNENGDIETGKTVSISLDAFGKVARTVAVAEAAHKFGYLSDLKHGTSPSPNVHIKVYEPASSNSNLYATSYQLADRVKINNTTYEIEEEKDDVVDLIETTAALASAGNVDFEDTTVTNAEYAQPIRFALDSQGKIKSIVTANYNTGNQGTNMSITSFMSDDEGEEGILCTVDGTTFGNILISSSTPVIYVPANRTSSEYQSKNSSFFKAGERYYVQFARPYSTSVSCIYLYGVAGQSGSITTTITEDIMPMVVTSVGDYVIDDSTHIITLKDITTGAEIEVLDNEIADADKDVSANELAIGDVVRVITSEKQIENRTFNVLERLQVLALGSEVTAGSTPSGELVVSQGSDSGTVSAEFRTLIGTVTSKPSSNQFTIASGFSGSGSAEAYTISDSVPVYAVDLAQVSDINKVKSVTSGEFRTGSKVMILTTNAQLRAVIIFKVPVSE